MPYETRTHEQNLIDLLIEAGEEGLTSGELAQQIGVTPQTVRNYLNRLAFQLVPIYETEGRRYAIDRSQYMQPLRLTLPQAWMLYLPLRRMLRANLDRYRVVYDLLHRLATNLHPDLAEVIAPETLSEPQDIDRIIPDLVEAWRTDHLIELRYQPLDKTYPSTLQVAPLWFEPAVWSDSHYLIAGFLKLDGTHKIQALKLERVLSVKSLAEKFVRPSTSEFLKQIQSAWGIWGGNGVVVKLRFHNRVRLRLLETRWHPSQHVEEDNQDHILWQAVIAEPEEMLPWIRGWGADVEVLEPAELREKIAIEAERTTRLYGRNSNDDSSFF